MKKLLALAFTVSMLFALGCVEQQPAPQQPTPNYSQQEYEAPKKPVRRSYNSYPDQPISQQDVRFEDIQ